MIVLVTGASGFIGTHVVQAFLDEGHEVIATSTNASTIEKKPWINQVKYQAYDLMNPLADSAKTFGHFDALVDLAWHGLPNYKSAEHISNNVVQHLNLIQSAIAAGVRNIVVAGTCFEYGMKSGALTEDLEPEPNNQYGIAKNMLRKSLQLLQKTKEFDLKWIRLFYTYGLGQNPKSIIPQLDAAIQRGDKTFNMSGGNQVRDYMHIDEIAKSIVYITEQNKITGIINCSSGKGQKLIDFITDYLKEKGESIKLNLGFYPYPDYEPMEFWGNNYKLTKILNQINE